MKNLKIIYKKLLFPPIWLMLLLTVISAVSLTAIFMRGLDNTPYAYVIYMLSFYTLCVVTVRCSIVFPKYYRKAKQKVYSNKFGNRYMTDVAFKTHVSLYLSLAVNLLYAASNMLLAIRYISVWFATLSCYYVILAVMRFLLLRFVGGTGIGQNRLYELKRSRLCAIILMTVNLALSGAVFMMIHQNKGYEYQGMLIYVMAMYTFYITTNSIINIFKYRKYNSPVMSTARAINLTAALVSMLSLETAMISQFGADNSPQFRRIMIASTGAGVSIIVVLMSIFMIVRANAEIKKLSLQKI